MLTEYLDLLRRNPHYRNLWLGNVVSFLGDWFNLLASAELITSLTNSGVAISSLFLARFLPLFFFSPIAGVIADRFDRKRILIASNLLRAAIVFCFIFIRTADQLWVLYALTVLQFALSAMFNPARTAVLTTIVPKKDLVTANALDSFTWSAMLALGSLLGGIVAALFGRNVAFALDALTFFIAALFIWRVAVPERAPITVEAGGGWFDFVDGFRYLRSEPFLLIVALAKAGGSLVWGAINVLEVNFAEEIFPLQPSAFTASLRLEDGGTAALGIIYLISGLGTGLGPLLLRRLLGSRPPRLMLGVGIGLLLMGIGISGLGLVPTFGLFLVMTFVRTIGTGSLWVFSGVLLQLAVPDKYRGRVFAFEFAALTLTQSLSILGAGAVQDSWDWSVQQTTLSFGLLGIAVAAAWFIFTMRSRGSARLASLSVVGYVSEVGDMADKPQPRD